MIYSPAEDSFLLEKYVRKYAKGKSFLDMGSGSGIQAEAALSSKAKSVLASDVNPQAISLLKSKGIKVAKSDLFSNIKEKFDLIAFNPPYLPHDKREDKDSSLITSGGSEGHELTVKFISQLKAHLTKDGFALIIVSSLSPLGKIEKELKKQNLSKEILQEQSFFMEKIQIWKVHTNI